MPGKRARRAAAGPAAAGPAALSTVGQMELDFEQVIRSAEVRRRQHDADSGEPYDPVEVTAEYVDHAVRLEEAWGTTLARAREALLGADPRELYYDFLYDLASQIHAGHPRADRLAALLEQVAVRGLGMTHQHVHASRPPTGGTKWRVRFDPDAIREHLATHVVGEHFLNPITVDDTHADRLLVGASDVSQHASAVPVPARFFKRTVPFVLNNAAGALFEVDGGKGRYHNLFNPKPDDALLRWMLIDPSYQDELEPEDYRRCLGSAMDVGQYRFDFEYLMKGDRRPHVIFRDGSLFPQDAYADNFIEDGRRAEFTRQAIKDLLTCLVYARETGILYCGVSKQVQLKVYSALVDWFIAREVDPDWEFGSYISTDGQAMSVLLASPAFVGHTLSSTVATCLIRRSFTTRATLNTRVDDLSNLGPYFADLERRQAKRPFKIDLTEYRRLCEVAHLYMFFVGHSRSPAQQLPRYEFFAPAEGPRPEAAARQVLTALQQCGFTIDADHAVMARDPVQFLMPSVTQQAHTISKDVGKHIDTVTGQWIMARFRRGLRGG